MSLQTLKDRLPDYAKDIKLNLGALAVEPVLNEKQRAGTFIAAALGARNADVVSAVMAEFAPQLDGANGQSSPFCSELFKSFAPVHQGMGGVAGFYTFLGAVGAPQI